MKLERNKMEPPINNWRFDSPSPSSYLINSCLICNNVFLSRSKNPIEKAVTRFRILCGVVQVPISDGDYEPEANLLCQKCDKVLDEFQKLQKQIERLIKILGDLRRAVGKKLVETYDATNKQRKNFRVKTQFFEFWRPKIKDQSAGSAQVEPKDLQQSFASILESLQEQELCSRFTENHSNPLNHLQKSTSHQNVCDNDDDRFSTECPSPASVAHDSCDNEDGDTRINHETVNRNAPLSERHEEAITNSGTDAEKVSYEFIPSHTTVPVVSTQPQLLTSMEDAHDRLELDRESKQEPQGLLATSIDKRGQRPIIKTRRRTHPCKYCGKLFPTNFSMQMHERTHTGEKPFSCSICGRAFNNKCAMEKHEKTHDLTRYEGPPEFECDICQKKYHLKYTLDSHRRNHFSEKKLKAAAKKLVDPNPPSKQKKTKKKEKAPNAPPNPKVRKEKNETLTESLELDEHEIPIPTPKAIKKSSKPPSDKPKRIRRELGPRKPRGAPPEPAVCSHCGKNCVTQQRLRNHLMIHTTEKPFKCEICGRGFSWKGNLDKHLKSHDRSKFEGEPAHICDLCGKGFYLAGTLYHHRRRVHLGFKDQYKKWKKEKRHRPCECKACGKKFTSTYQLEYHREIHTQKRYPCKICGKPFSHSQDARTHSKKHEPNFLYNLYFRHQCPACPPERLGFQNKPAMRKHWKEEHKDLPLPEKFVQFINRPPPGEYICEKCPEIDGKRPQYRHLRSLQKHEKVYHSENSKRKWKPQKKRIGYAKKQKKMELSEDDSMSESDSQSTSEEEESISTNLSTRKSLRQNKGNIRSLLSHSDGELEDRPEDRKKRMHLTSKLPKNTATKRNVKYRKMSNTKQSQYRNILGRKELWIILTRVDQSVSKVSNGSLQKLKSSKISNASTNKQNSSADDIGAEDNQTENATQSQSFMVQEEEIQSNLKITHIGNMEVSHEALEIKQEENCDMVADDFSKSTFVDSFLNAPSSKKPLSNAPIVIYNPLSKNKAAAPIIFPASNESTTITPNDVDPLGEEA